MAYVQPSNASRSSNLTVTVTAKPKRRTSDDSDRTPCPSDIDARAAAAAATKLKYRRPNDALGSYRTVSPASQPSKALKPQLPLPDDEEDTTYSSRRRSSGHAQRPGLVSPISPTAAQKLAELQLRPDRENVRPGVRMPSSQPSSTTTTTFRKPAASARGPDAHRASEWGGRAEEQLTDASAALRRAEAERQKVRDQMEAQRADRYNMQRELEEVRRENRRLAARLNEALKSPLNARNDDAWGCSMYDIEIDGH